VSPLDKDIIRKKLAIIIENLNALEPIPALQKKSTSKIYIKEKHLKGSCRN